MTTTLYEATVERFIQTLGGVAGFLERGLSHCADNGVEPQDLVEARLWDDMLPLSFQIVSVCHHSIGAIEGAKQGQFSPGARDTHSYDKLQAMVADALTRLQALSREEVNALESQSVTFKVGERELPFQGDGFLLSFSLPNFYFHASTAYDILRSKGVPLGKRDFIGQLRMKS